MTIAVDLGCKATKTNKQTKAHAGHPAELEVKSYTESSSTSILCENVSCKDSVKIS